MCARTLARLASLLLMVRMIGGCATVAETKRFVDRDRAEANTDPFRPAPAAVAPRRNEMHLAVFFDATDGQLALAARPAELRPGRLPYRRRSAGPFEVSYRNAQGRIIGSYRRDDPATVRVCDTAQGAPLGAVPIATGVVEVLVPADFSIATLQFTRLGEKPQTVPVADLIRRAAAAVPGNP